MTSTTSCAVEFYLSIVHNPTFLAEGYQRIKTFLLSCQQNREDTLMNLLHPEVPVLTLVNKVYVGEVFSSPMVSPEEKQKTREYLLKLLLDQLHSAHHNKHLNHKLCDGILLFIREIHQAQGFTDWIQPYQRMIQVLVKQTNCYLGYFLTQVLKYADDRVSHLTRHVLPYVLTTEIGLSADQAIEIIYYCLKSMAYLKDTDDQTLDQYLSPHTPSILQFIKCRMHNSLSLMRYSLKCLTVLYGEYQQPCDKQMMALLQQVCLQLCGHHVTRINTHSQSQEPENRYTAIQEINQEEEEVDNAQQISLMIFQMLELIDTLMESQGETQGYMANHVLISIALCSCLLDEVSYTHYLKVTDQYVADIQDQGYKSLRNKGINILRLLTPVSSNTHLLQQYLKISIFSQPSQIHSQLTKFYSDNQLSGMLGDHKLTLHMQCIQYICYSFADELFTESQSRLPVMLRFVALISQRDSLENIAMVNTLNRWVMKFDPRGQHNYHVFLMRSIQQYQGNIGMLFMICRGIANYPHFLLEKEQDPIPITTLIQQLLQYLLSTDPSQLQCSHIAFDFLKVLANKNKPKGIKILESVLDTQLQLQLIRNYFNDAMVADTLAGVLETLATELVIQAIWKELISGKGQEAWVGKLVAKWVQQGMLKLDESGIMVLLQQCSHSQNSLDSISPIVKAYLHTTQGNISQPLNTILNHQLHHLWIPQLLKYSLLSTPQEALLSTITKLLDLTSQYQLQCQLLLPYYLILQQPSLTMNTLMTNQLYYPFLDKLFKYAQLFRGNHLKIMTSHVVLELCQHDQQLRPKAIRLVDMYGEIKSSQWEDLDGEEGEDEELDCFEKMMELSEVNEQVEKQMAEVFQEMAWEPNAVQHKLHKIR